VSIVNVKCDISSRTTSGYEFSVILKFRQAGLQTGATETGANMQHEKKSSAQTISYLIEHSHGTCELWVRRSKGAEITTYEPLRLLRVSGKGTVLLRTEVIEEAIHLEEWMADNFAVFTEGRAAYE
jgi:hypothetical protein